MGTGCSREVSVPAIEPTIAAGSGRPPGTASKGSPKPGRRFSADPFEGGPRPIANLDFSLRQLLRVNEGAPAFRSDEHHRAITYRVKLNPPPFELQTPRGQQIAQLSRDTKSETPSLLVLTGKSVAQNDIWGGHQPAVGYEVRIPASTLLDERDLDAGIAYRGQLSIGAPKSSLSGKQRVKWLIR
jgi:hypothetical protein